MRMVFRLRTALVATALAAIILAHASSRWKRGDFEFQKHHARLAYEHEAQAARHREELDWLMPHTVPGHSCTLRICKGYKPGGMAKRAAISRERLMDANRNYRWHRRLAGPAYGHGLSIIRA